MFGKRRHTAGPAPWSYSAEEVEALTRPVGREPRLHPTGLARELAEWEDRARRGLDPAGRFGQAPHRPYPTFL